MFNGSDIIFSIVGGDRSISLLRLNIDELALLLILYVHFIKIFCMSKSILLVTTYTQFTSKKNCFFIYFCCCIFNIKKNVDHPINFDSRPHSLPRPLCVYRNYTKFIPKKTRRNECIWKFFWRIQKQSMRRNVLFFLNTITYRNYTKKKNFVQVQLTLSISNSSHETYSPTKHYCSIWQRTSTWIFEIH